MLSSSLKHFSPAQQQNKINNEENMEGLFLLKPAENNDMSQFLYIINLYRSIPSFVRNLNDIETYI